MKQKSMASNFVFNLLYNAMNLLFPLITIPYVSRILLAEGNGRVSYAQNIVTYFLIFAQLGIPKYGIREIAKARDQKEELSKLFYEILTINAVSTTIALIAYYGMIVGFRLFPERTELFAVAGMTIAFNYVNCDWLYVGLEEYRYVTLRSFVVKFVSLILILLFVRNEGDTIQYALIYCVGVGGNNLFNVIHARKYVQKPRVRLQLKKHLSPIFILLSTNIAVELYTQLDTTMTGAICGETYVGYYTNTVKLTRLVVTMITTVGAILLPRLSYYYKNGEQEVFQQYISKALKIILFFSVPAMIGIFAFSDPVVLIVLGQDFAPSSMTLRILSLLIPILAVGNLFGSQILMITGQEGQLMRSVMIGAIVNIIMNSMLIPVFQQNGAAMGSVIAEFTVMIVQIAFAKRYVNCTIEKRYVASLLGANAFVAIACSLLVMNVSFRLVTILLVCTCIAITYLGIGFLLKNEAAIYLLTRVKIIITSKLQRKS